jgi:glycosyltransferase involved in cell wall biosynthesis
LKIVFSIDTLNAGGKERQLIETLKAFSSDNVFEVSVVVFNHDCFYAEEANKYASHFFEIDKSNKFRALLKFRKVLGHIQPDIVHTWDFFSSIFSNALKPFFSYKVIDGSIRDSGVDIGSSKKLRKFFLNRANIVISNSFAGLNYYGVKGDVIYNAIDSDRFSPSQSEVENVMAMVANFTDYKDHHTFIMAATELIERDIIEEAWLIGDGPHLATWTQYVQEKLPNLQSRIKFLGRINNVEEVLKGVRYGVLCSTLKYSEGVSNSLLEYLAQGVIAIATDIGGSGEIIKHGINGFLVSPKGSQEIVAIIEEISEDLERQKLIIKAGKETIANKFSVEINLERLKTIYKDVTQK